MSYPARDRTRSHRYSDRLLDYASRCKFGGNNLNFFVYEQLPILPPSTYEQTTPWLVDERLSDFGLSRVLELTYTAWDLESFANDCGYEGPPFRWDEERRFLLRCELDAAFFHLYLPAEANGEWKTAGGETPQQLAELKRYFPTPRHAVDHMLETFPFVVSNCTWKHGALTATFRQPFDLIALANRPSDKTKAAGAASNGPCPD